MTLEFIRRQKIDAWLAGDRAAFQDWEEAETVELETGALYSRYVSWGVADTDGYFAPISRAAFSQLTRERQEAMAR